MSSSNFNMIALSNGSDIDGIPFNAFSQKSVVLPYGTSFLRCPFCGSDDVGKTGTRTSNSTTFAAIANGGTLEKVRNIVRPIFV